MSCAPPPVAERRGLRGRLLRIDSLSTPDLMELVRRLEDPVPRGPHVRPALG
ncbi:MAG: hypothetical protein IT165_11850 [Bryobacterales bacterium]|nr:hypothetical protein [Bryobacterales bacterium]